MFYIAPGARVIVVCEKRFAAQEIAKYWPEIFPGVEFKSITTSYGVPGGFSTRLPREMPISAVPTIAEPLFNTDGLKLQVVGADGKLCDEDGIALLKEADLFICATDMDPAGAYGFWNLLRTYLGQEVADRRHLYLKANGYDEHSIVNALSGMQHTSDEQFQLHLAAAKLKRTFDASWAVNAVPCFSPILARLGVPEGKRFISKYALQLLFWFDGESGPAIMREVLQTMQDWTGTGKYKMIKPSWKTGNGVAAELRDLYSAVLAEGALSPAAASLFLSLEGRAYHPIFSRDEVEQMRHASRGKAAEMFKLSAIEPVGARKLILERMIGLGLLPTDTGENSIITSFNQMGSPASKAAIIDQLAAAGLIETKPTTRRIRPFTKEGHDELIGRLVEAAEKGEMDLPPGAEEMGYKAFFERLAGEPDPSVICKHEGWQISPRGRAFIAALHSGCKDLDLPFRLHEWMGNPEKSEASMKMWINRFFGRQKRYASKAIQ